MWSLQADSCKPALRKPGFNQRGKNAFRQEI